ncbi:hypothetical protein DFH07DRAFT_328486 [Mycena maculata]|uniref:Uncharacterized protein n=1 Tax=Mycena maculata TaxID=230809 RepID=A0AAD7NN10_9AGAR|nr:hypothetical protein DFH07DRAFT_328486 [Mycena maculata]
MKLGGRPVTGVGILLEGSRVLRAASVWLCLFASLPPCMYQHVVDCSWTQLYSMVKLFSTTCLHFLGRVFRSERNSLWLGGFRIVTSAKAIPSGFLFVQLIKGIVGKREYYANPSTITLLRVSSTFLVPVSRRFYAAVRK